MTLVAYPEAKRGASYSIDNLTGERRDGWSTRCSDCLTTFCAHSAEDAQEMWWRHVRDEHPNAWSFLRDNAPESVRNPGSA